MRWSRTLLLVLLALASAACEQRSARAPEPSQPRTTVEPVQPPRPEPPPDVAEGQKPAQYPIYVFPREPRPNDPIRNPAVMPRLIESRPPEYPAEALRQRIQGDVILEIVIEKNGRISSGRVLKPLPAGLPREAIQAVEHWRYSPGTDRHGNPVRCLLTVTVPFRLRTTP